jgi:tetratricopeptide (TPR) repeat protein
MGCPLHNQSSLLPVRGAVGYGATAAAHRDVRSIADTPDPERTTADVDLLARASEGLELVLRDAPRAEELLRSVLDHGDTSTDAAADALIIAFRGLGKLHLERGDAERATSYFASGAELADHAGRPRQGALLRMSWSGALQLAGDNDGALRQLAAAEPHLGGGDLALLVMQRGFLLWACGRPAEALDDYDRALPALQEAAEHDAVIRLLGNRGIVRAQVGALRAARADIQLQRQLAVEHAQNQVAASALHNLGWLEGRLGNVPAALELFAAARAEYERLGRVDRVISALDTDECEVLLQANLAIEADELAERVVEGAAASGNVAQMAEASLMRARASVAMGRFERAHQQAGEAADLFRRTGRPAWAAMAEYVGEQAALAEPGLVGPADASEVERLRRIADELAGAGWVLEAAEVRVHAGRAALRAGLVGPAREELQLAARARETGIAAVRAEAWHATALLRLADGNERGARRAIEAGLRALDRHRATLGAIELRAHASAHGVELGQLGLRLAINTGNAADVLVWAERWRAGALALPVPKVGADAELATLRELHASADEALAPRIASAERAVTAKARLVPGDPRSVVSRVDVRALRQALNGHILVEYLEVDDELQAVIVTAHRTRLVPIGPTSQVLDVHDHLVFALRRLSMLPAHHPALAGATAALATAAREIDDLLVAPLQLPEGPLVLVPTGGLHRVAWSALPSLHARSTTVTPSAAWWLGRAPIAHHAPAPSTGAARVLLVEGPDLEGTAAELAALQELLPQALTLTGSDATAQRVLAGLATADIAHIAAHGAFRGDNPLFSSLRVADGPIWVHDFAGLPRTPRLVILTACEAGRSGVLAGDELLGTATALLSLGVETVIAPLLPVPDIATARFAIRLHHHLARGATPAEARTRTAADERASGDPTGLAVASTFQCIGNRHSDQTNP